MHLLLLPLFALVMVPLFVVCTAVFALGAVLRLLFVVALVFAAGFLLFGRGVLRAGFCHWRSQHHQRAWSPRCQHFDDRSKQDRNNSAFDDYRRATLRRLEDEAREFRAFLARLRERADAADFQDFLKSRRAGGPQNS
jgi:hypothetical protein